MKRYLAVFTLFTVLVLLSLARAERSVYWFVTIGEKLEDRSVSSLLQKVILEEQGYKGILITNNLDSDIGDYILRLDLNSLSLTKYTIQVIDENSSSLDFCYEHDELVCNTDPTNVVWIRIPLLPAKSSVRIYVREADDNYAKTGYYVFDAYGDFEDYDETVAHWKLNEEDSCINLHYYHATLETYVYSNNCNTNVPYNSLGYVPSAYYYPAKQDWEYPEGVDAVLEMTVVNQGVGAYSEVAIGVVGWVYIVYGLDLDNMYLFDSYSKTTYASCSALDSIVPNVPYRVKLVYSFTDKTIDLYVNGNYCETFESETDLPFIQPTITTDADGVFVYFDNVVLYKSTDGVTVNIE